MRTAEFISFNWPLKALRTLRTAARMAASILFADKSLLELFASMMDWKVL